MLTLTKTFPDRPDDYIVKNDGKKIGRIYKTPGMPPSGMEWLWVYYRGSDTSPQAAADRGNAATLETAKAAFKARMDI